MKIFDGSTFIEKEKLIKEGIKHPIKLEYYKLINEDEIIQKKKPKFGIDVVKTEYIEDKIKVENKCIPYMSDDENKVDEILNIFKENKVTPIAVEDIIVDLSKKSMFI